MKILIRQARIVDPNSPHNGLVKDLFIENGFIQSIDDRIEKEADKIVEADNLHLSPGWMDVFANFADPGYEFKETLETGAMAALHGGYTDVMLIPNTQPIVHNKSGIEYLVQKGRSLPVNVHPIGAVTKNTKGDELAEMYDMKASGAIAFSDGTQSIQSAGLLLKALQYIKTFKGVVIQLPDDQSINPQGLMNEGIISTQLGLPGKPAMSEEIVIDRDIKLTRYTDSRIHFTGVSSERSLEYIKKAKKAGLNVSCSVTPNHLFFCDEDLETYDSNLKLNPPLRTKKDREALQKALRDSVIDCIATHHLPQERDSKLVEFEYAKYGTIGLETAFAVINTAMPGENPETWVRILSLNPRKIFGLPDLLIAASQPACLTAFDPQKNWVVELKDIKSRSKNSPYLQKTLTGKVVATINKNQLFINQ
ncbi:MAG: dihydroorotase [Chitinophagaceae bacterium]|jgi:dihydroorotase|nr:dihydroorotase [Chitinophagaceae bacterium]